MPTSPCFLADVTPKQLEKYLDDHPEVPGSYYRFFKDNYLNKGLVDREAVASAAKDLNIPQDHLRRILDRPKTVRKYNAAVAEAARKRRDFLRDNEDYVRNLGDPYLSKLVRMLYNAPRSSLLFQHGGTAASTHAMPYLERIDKWHLWLDSFRRGFQSINPTYERKLRAEIEKDPWHKYARDVGGVDVVFRDTPTGWKAVFGWNKRAFNAALIPLRLREFKANMRFWSGKVDLENYDQLAKDVGRDINHATGTLSSDEGRGISSIFALAPKLMQAGWYKAVIDPTRTIATYAKMLESKVNKNLYVSDSARRANHMRAVHTAAWLTSTAGLLALNQGLLKATGQKQNINFGWGPNGDFSKTDLWRFKFDGWVIRPRGGIENLALIARVINMFGKSRKELHGKTPVEAVQQIIGQYAEYKAHPFISTGLEIAAGQTLYGEKTPWGTPRKGQVQLTWPEYALEHGPIFIGGAVHEFYSALREQGMSVNDLNALFRGLSNTEAMKRAGIAGFSEFFGFGVYKERPPSTPRGKAASFYSP